MTTSPTAFLHEIVNYQPIPAGKLAYFRARLQDRIYNLVTREFLRKENANQMSRSDLADRLGKDPAQITRHFASPGNWTLDTISDLLLGVAASELEIGLSHLAAHASTGSPVVIRLDSWLKKTDRDAATEDSAKLKVALVA